MCIKIKKFKELNKCLHENKKAISSNKLPDSNFITVKCLECGSIRYETRYASNRIDTSEWFTKKKLNKLTNLFNL